MHYNTSTSSLFILVLIALLINYAIVVFIRTIYRHRMINKYQYDYYDHFHIRKKPIFAKLTINLVQTIKKTSTIYYTLGITIAEVALYMLIG